MSCELNKVISIINEVANGTKNRVALQELTGLMSDLTQFSVSMQSTNEVKDVSKLLDTLTRVSKSTGSINTKDTTSNQTLVQLAGRSNVIDISSGTKGLPGALTNHTVLSKKKGSIENDYPIEFNGTKYDSVESAYQGNKVNESKTKPAKEDSENYKLMVELISEKFSSYPQLLEALTKAGGLKYLENAVHQPTTKNTVWETGGQDWFISALREAYINVSSESAKISNKNGFSINDSNKESKTDEYITSMLSKINPTLKIEEDKNLFKKYLDGVVTGFAHYSSKENKIVLPVLPEINDSNRLEYIGQDLYMKMGFKSRGSDHNYFQKRYGVLQEDKTYDMTKWFDKFLKDSPDSVIEYAEGYYTLETAKEIYEKEIETGFFSKEGFERVIRHEKVHAYTSMFIRNNPEHKVTKSINKLYREAMLKMPKTSNPYWKKNIHEFVAEAMSNQEVRDLLKVIPTEQVKSKISIFDRLVELLLESLGLKRGNIYSELLYALNNIPIEDIKTDKLIESKHLSKYKQNTTINSNIIKILNGYDTDEYKNVVTTGKNGSRRALWFGDADYQYSGVTHKATAMHPYVKVIAEDIEKETGVPIGYFNSVLINEYKDNKGLGAHPDNEPIFRDKDGNIGKIASLTLSGKGLVTIFDNKGKKVEEHSVSVGDLYIMPGDQFQDNFKHKVDTTGEDNRISLTFRHIPLENIASESDINLETTKIEKLKSDPTRAKIISSVKEEEGITFTKSDLSWVMARLAEGLDTEAIELLNTNKTQAIVELDKEIKQYQKELDEAASENDKETVREFTESIKNLNNAKEQLKEENAEVSSTFFKRDKDTYYTKKKTNYRKVFIPSEGTPKDKMKHKNILNSLFAAIRSDLSFGNGPRDIHDTFSKYSDIYTKEIKEFIEVKSSLDKGIREMKDIAEWEDFAKQYIINGDNLIELFNKKAEEHGLPKPKLADSVDSYEFGFSAQFLKESTKQEVGKMTTKAVEEMEQIEEATKPVQSSEAVINTSLGTIRAIKAQGC